jgi:hypothetical protein
MQLTDKFAWIPGFCPDQSTAELRDDGVDDLTGRGSEGSEAAGVIG